MDEKFDSLTLNVGDKVIVCKHILWGETTYDIAEITKITPTGYIDVSIIGKNYSTRYSRSGTSKQKEPTATSWKSLMYYTEEKAKEIRKVNAIKRKRHILSCLNWEHLATRLNEDDLQTIYEITKKYD